MSGIWEHFRCAALVLAGPGSVKQRLSDAYLRHLKGIDRHDLPEAIESQFMGMLAALHAAKAAGGLTAVEVSVRKMSEADAGGHAASIMEMFVALSGSHFPAADAAPPRLRIVGEADDELPSFLVNRA